MVVEVHIGSRLSDLPSVAGWRAATTTTRGTRNGTSTNLVGNAVNHPVAGFVGDVPNVVIIDLVEGKVPIGRISNAINALGGASGPIRPRGELAVLLKALELVRALDASINGDRSGADTDFIERSLD